MSGHRELYNQKVHGTSFKLPLFGGDSANHQLTRTYSVSSERLLRPTTPGKEDAPGRATAPRAAHSDVFWRAFVDTSDNDGNVLPGGLPAYFAKQPCRARLEEMFAWYYQLSAPAVHKFRGKCLPHADLAAGRREKLPLFLGWDGQTAHDVVDEEYSVPPAAAAAGLYWALAEWGAPWSFAFSPRTHAELADWLAKNASLDWTTEAWFLAAVTHEWPRGEQ